MDRAEILLQALESGCTGILHVRGTSMLPTLREGTAVRIRPVRADEIPVGRIAVFRKDRMLVIHRLVWKTDSADRLQYLFKGDNAAVIDAVSADRVLGVVDGIVAAGDGEAPEGAACEPLRRDPAGVFYRSSHLVFSPLLRFVGFLTGRPPALPSGRLRTLLKRLHRGVERILFGRPNSR
jgi:hypothetical protein